MKTLSKILAALVLAAGFSLSARAQFVTWETGTSANGTNTFDITGPSDIATNGTYVDALSTHGNGYTDGSGGPVVTDVTNPTTGVTTQFNIYTSTSGGVFSDGTFSIVAGGDSGSDGSGSDATPYQKVLDDATFIFTPGIGTVTMNGLTKGAEYQIQVWASDGGRPTTYTSGTNIALANFVPNSTGEYVIGTFIAQGSTQSFDFQNTYPIDVSAGEIDALSLRELPEPSTYALLFVGAGALLLFAHRRVTA